MKFSEIALAGAALLAIWSCNSETNVQPFQGSQETQLSISFNHQVDGSDVQLDKVIYENERGQNFSISTIKYFISQVRLHKLDASSITMEDIHFVDVKLPETVSYDFAEKVPYGEYSGLSFVLGLIPEENISKWFTDPPESLMEWPDMMGGGYHYMKLEGIYEVGDLKSFYNFHSGMLDGEAYEVHVDIPDYLFTVDGEELKLEMTMEIQNWFYNPNSWDFVYYGPAIMGNHEAQKSIQENGKDVFSVKQISE